MYKFKVRLVGVLMLIFGLSSVIAQKKKEPFKLDANSNTVKSIFNDRVNDKDLDDYQIVIENIPNGHSTSDYKFDFENNTVLGNIIDGTHNLTNNILTYNLRAVKYEGLEGKKTEFKYKISYTGGSSSTLFSANSNVLNFSLTVDKSETPPPPTKSFSQLQIQKAATEYIQEKIDSDEIKYDFKRNIYYTFDENDKRDDDDINKTRIVHIFIDENGNLILSGIPTTATKKYVYQVHLLVEKNNINKSRYKFSADGKFKPKFNINNTQDETPEGNSVSNEPVIVEYLSPTVGPYTNKFTLKVLKYQKGKKVEKLLDSEVEIATTYQVSLSTGILSTTLRNPENIQKLALASGDSTLVADNPDLRGAITIMATFYFKERNFLFPPEQFDDWRQRIGLQVGTQINDDLAENFFLGLSYDLTWGSSVSAGVHFGRRNYVAGVEDFEFGKDIFDLPELVIKKEWQAGLYFGMVIDTRVAFKLISNLAGKN